MTPFEDKKITFCTAVRSFSNQSIYLVPWETVHIKQLGRTRPEGNDSPELHCQGKQSCNKHTPQPHTGEFPPGDNHLEN